MRFFCFTDILHNEPSKNQDQQTNPNDDINSLSSSLCSSFILKSQSLIYLIQKETEVHSFKHVNHLLWLFHKVGEILWWNFSHNFVQQIIDFPEILISFFESLFTAKQTLDIHKSLVNVGLLSFERLNLFLDFQQFGETLRIYKSMTIQTFNHILLKFFRPLIQIFSVNFQKLCFFYQIIL